MRSLQDQLVKAGLVSEGRTTEVAPAEVISKESPIRYEVDLMEYRDGLMSEDSEFWDDLKDTPSIRGFRRKACELLTWRPDLIRDVIRLAFNFRHRGVQGKRLMWQIFSVRHKLKRCAPAARKKVFTRAFQIKRRFSEMPKSAAK